MKNSLKKVIVCVLVLLLVCAVLVACSEDITPVMRYQDTELPDYVYRYWAATYKATFLSQVSGATDSSEFWNREYKDGYTHAAYCKKNIDSIMRQLTAALYLFDFYELSISDSLLDRIESDIDEKERYQGDDFYAELDRLGITRDQLEQIYIFQEQYNAVRDYWIGDRGQISISAEQMESYYTDNYVCIKHIKLDMNRHMVKNEDGSFSSDRGLEEYEKFVKRDLLAQLAERAEQGESFSSLQQQYAEENLENFPNGILFDPQNTAAYVGVFSDLFLEKMDELVQASGRALYFEDGQIGYVLYQCDTLPKINQLTDNEKVFLDGLENAVKNQIFAEQLEIFARDVEQTNQFASIDFASIPVKRSFSL